PDGPDRRDRPRGGAGPAALRGAAEGAAGLVHPEVRAQREPGQHHAGRRHPARDAAPRPSGRHPRPGGRPGLSAHPGRLAASARPDIIRRVVARIRHLAALAAAAGLVAAPAALADRPARPVFRWGQELRHQKRPGWKPNRNPVSVPRGTPLVNGILATAGQNGLWFSGSAALPFDLPIRSSEPIQWFTPARYLDRYQRTGLSFDVNL